ncbi:FAD-dependent oxidoreductase [Virgibacillus sp. 179-BFC.A HS]|uniref:FAD-dependent oxidoreductase n=1 Tax=Tigheibacillus jepli TaxID=3035914 RepID=A0ABU5CJR2_9BACI|nr:FAD-dependent oxidoreductase [Virgibacillus sp. 179-BFC.A HS]MDY0406475.1 FAD-dependent oxidoreductase [Virgibacillus sp. 179-BFC.A HS]
MKKPIVIVGAGLSGLRAASLLHAQGIECKVLEARARIGGRILSISDSKRQELGHFDLGPTWFWPEYERTIAQLVKELNVKTSLQYNDGAMLSEQFQNKTPERYILPEGSVVSSVRFAGGAQTLVDAIADTIPAGVIDLETQVRKIRLEKDGTITVEADLADETKKEFPASAVILALPPRIVARRIEFTPFLSSNLIADLINKPTWMAGQAKAVAIYDYPFWRESGLSGFATSRIGPLQEIHDASPETGAGALFGFFGIPAKVRQKIGKDDIYKLVVDQLIRLFGSPAQNISAFLYKDWAKDSETAVAEDLAPLRDFPSYGQIQPAGIWKKKIFLPEQRQTHSMGVILKVHFNQLNKQFRRSSI